MNCKKCDNNLFHKDKFCSKCGSKSEYNIQIIKLILIRVLLLTILVIVFFMSGASEIFDGILFYPITLLFAACYISILYVLIKKFKIVKYDICLLTNFISVVVYAFLSLFIFKLYGEIDCSINGRCGENYSVLAIFIFNLAIIPVSLVANAIIDVIVINFNKKSNKLINEKK